MMRQDLFDTTAGGIRDVRAVLITVAGLAVLGGAFVLGQRVGRDVGPRPAEQRGAPVAATPVAPVAVPPTAAPPAAPVPPPPSALAAPPPALPPSPPATSSPATSSPATALPATALPTVAAPAAPPPTQAEADPPRFDHVRVSAQGEMVLAGRAAPGAEVTILFGADTLGVVRADLRGEWVFVPATPVRGGNRELALRARLPDGQVVQGVQPVLVLVPEAAPPASALARVEEPPAPAALPTVVELPREPAGLPRVLQAPPALAATAPPVEPAPQPPPLLPLAALPGPAAPTPAPGAAATPARGPVSLQVVDYDDQGEVRFAGTATAGAPVRVYVNNAPVADTVAGADGRWQASPAAPVSPGVHQLRVDQLSASGQVSARVEAPFQRVEISPEILAGGRVVVQPGQNLWRIARAAYGRGVRYTVIYQANREQIRDPRLIYPGQVFAVPAAAN